LIELGVGGRRRTGGLALAIRKIAAKGVHANGSQAISQCDQQRGVAVPSRAMSEHKEIFVGGSGVMKKSLNGCFARFAIDERLCF